MIRILFALTILAMAPISCGCYHIHVLANGDAKTSTYFKQNVNSFWWGTRPRQVAPPARNKPKSQRPPAPADCVSNGARDVVISSSLPRAFATVATAGIWSPIQFEWKCATDPPVIGPAPQPSPSGPNQADMPIWKRTVNAVAWGAIVDKLEPLPPDSNKPGGGPPNPGNCKTNPFSNGMNFVKVPVNPFYSLLTVGTAGFWSPMTVEWQCAVYQPGAAAGTSGAEEGHVTR